MQHNHFIMYLFNAMYSLWNAWYLCVQLVDKMYAYTLLINMILIIEMGRHNYLYIAVL